MTIRNPLHQLAELSDQLRMRENDQEEFLVRFLSEMSVLEWNSLSVEAKALLKRCVVKYGIAEKLTKMRSLSIDILKWEPNQTASPECPSSSASETNETWITDEPPPAVGAYLVTLQDTLASTRRKTCRAWWTGTFWGSYNRRMWTVIAWKPMPEPMQ